MTNKLALGITSVLMGIILLFSLIIPWFQVNTILRIQNFYPLWEGNGGNLSTQSYHIYSYLAGIFIILGATLSIILGMLMISGKRGRGLNTGVIFSSVLGIIAFILYMIFIYKISPDYSGHIFSYHGFGGFGYGIQFGYYLEIVASAFLLIVSIIFTSLSEK